MNLGELRNLTRDLPDDCMILKYDCEEDEYYETNGDIENLRCNYGCYYRDDEKGVKAVVL